MADLRDQLETLAGSVKPQSPDEVLRRARLEVESRTRDQGSGVRRARVVVALVAAAAVLATAAAVVLVRSTTRDSGQPAGPTTGTTLPPLFLPNGETDGTLFLVPTEVPAGLEVFRVAGGGQPGSPNGASGSPSVDGAQTWTRLDEAGQQVAQQFSIQWDFKAGHVDREFGRPLPSCSLECHVSRDAERVSVRGRDGLYGRGTLAWEEPKGRVVSIGSQRRGAKRLSREELLKIAEGLRRRKDDGFDLRYVPHGFRFTGEADGMASDGNNKRSVVYRASDQRGFMLDVLDDTQQSPVHNLFDPRAHIVKVRGLDAVATPMLTNGGGGTFDSQTLWLFGSDQFVQWVEPGRTLVTLRSVGLSADELLDVARRLRSVDRAEWEAFTAQAPGRIGAAPVPKQPPNFTGEKAEIAEAVRAAFDGDSVDTVAPYLEDGSELTAAIETTFATVQPGDYTAEVHRIRVVNPTSALVSFTILRDGRPFLDNQQGAAIKIGDTWLVRRATYCAIVEIGQARCPAPTAPTTGPPPTNEVAARRAVTETFVKANDSDTPLRQRIALVDNSRGLRAAYEAARRSFPEALADYTVEVRDVRFTNENEAVVVYDLLAPGAPVTEFPNRIGGVVRIEGEWKVTRATVCGILGLAQAGGCTAR